jgi:hypothetical protein
MRYVSPPLAELTAHAQSLTSAGDLVGARRLLARVLDSADTADPRHANADLAVAAALHARVLIALGDPHAAQMWAGFAHAAEDRLHGPQDERTVAAAATHAAVLQRVGHHGRAAQVYHGLVGDLTRLDGPDSPRVLAAEADLATAEHAAGQCTAARARLADAWLRHRRRYGDAAPAGIKMLARLGAMERECGRDAESREHLAQAQELCARYLPADHPLVRQVAALAVAQPSGRHRCGRLQQSTGPAPAAPQGGAPRPVGPPQPSTTGEVGPPPAGGPSHVQPQPGSAAWPVPPAPARAPWPVAPPATGAPPPFGPPDAGAPMPAEGSPGPAGVTALDAPGVRQVPFPRRPTVPDPAADFPPDDPGLPPPDNRPVDAERPHHGDQLYRPGGHQDRPGGHQDRPGGSQDPAGGSQDPASGGQDPAGGSRDPAGSQDPARGAQDPAGGHQYLADGPQEFADGHQDLAGGGPAPGDLTGRHAQAGTAAPLPGRRAPDYGPFGAAPGSIDTLTPGDERRLPVPMDTSRPRRSRQPFVLTAVLAAGIAAAAAVVIMTFPGSHGPAATPTRSAAPAASAPAASAPAVPAPAGSAQVSTPTSPAPATSAVPGAPQNVRLRDNRDSVSLQWTYPKGSEGPVLISGGRAGQEQRAFQQLPAGSSDYVVYGLNDTQNYCFTVAVAYSTDRIANSPTVCTKR